MFFYDWTYFLVLIGAAICMIASANVKSTYQRFSTQRSMTNMTGAQVAVAKPAVAPLVIK